MCVLVMWIEAGKSRFPPQTWLGLRGYVCETTYFNLPAVKFLRVVSADNSKGECLSGEVPASFVAGD